MPLQRTLVGKVDVTYRSHMSLDPGVSGDMVKVTRTNHEALSTGFTPISRPFLVYQIHVRIQSIFEANVNGHCGHEHRLLLCSALT